MHSLRPGAARLPLIAYISATVTSARASSAGRGDVPFVQLRWHCASCRKTLAGKVVTSRAQGAAVVRARAQMHHDAQWPPCNQRRPDWDDPGRRRWRRPSDREGHTNPMV